MQVQDALDGKTPYLRGTIDMIKQAQPAFQAAGTDLVVLFQLTWSTGGDGIAVRPTVTSPASLRGKTIALNLYGPHAYYITKILADAGLKPADVKFKWFRELSIPKESTNKVIDPVTAFTKTDYDAVMAISPDLASLTSGGKVGTGAEGSVKGARIMLTTKSASRIIADVYAVRKDYYDANFEKVEAFRTAWLQSEEALRDLLKNKAGRRSEYQQLLTRAATVLENAPQATSDMEGLLGDCTFVGYNGNIAFFTGKGTTRTLTALNNEINTAFVAMGLIPAKTQLPAAKWDNPALTSGLHYATTEAPKPAFDAPKLARAVEKSYEGAESTSFGAPGTLFKIEMLFAPNKPVTDYAQYYADFEKGIRLADTYGGAALVIEGHSDPKGIADARAAGTPDAELRLREQRLKTLSLQRAEGVRQAYIAYAKSKGFTVDPSQVVTVGRGTAAPKFPQPKTEEEWKQNFRVVFVIKAIEAESTSFTPSGK